MFFFVPSASSSGYAPVRQRITLIPCQKNAFRGMTANTKHSFCIALYTNLFAVASAFILLRDRLQQLKKPIRSGLERRCILALSEAQGNGHVTSHIMSFRPLRSAIRRSFQTRDQSAPCRRYPCISQAIYAVCSIPSCPACIPLEKPA